MNRRIEIYIDGNLPRGWVRLSNEAGGEIYGSAVEIADALRTFAEGVQRRGTARDDADFWDALQNFEDAPPYSCSCWPPNLIAVEQIGEEDADFGPPCLLQIETNNGTRWAAGKHDGAWCTCLSDWIALFEGFEDDRQAALDTWDALDEGCDACNEWNLESDINDADANARDGEL
jgi:hypothetical protein